MTDRDERWAEVARLRGGVETQEALVDEAIAGDDTEMIRTTFRRLVALKLLLKQAERDVDAGG